METHFVAMGSDWLMSFLGDESSANFFKLLRIITKIKMIIYHLDLKLGYFAFNEEKKFLLRWETLTDFHKLFKVKKKVLSNQDFL